MVRQVFEIALLSPRDADWPANNLVGWIGGLLEKTPATHFWLLHAALAGTAGIIFLIAVHFFGHLLAPGENESAAPPEL
jgi:hypothetical protein